MEPIFIILLAAIIPIVLTLVLTRVQDPSPAMRRALWILLGVGIVAFGIVGYLAITL
jgi:uncharacterized membrane protein